MKITKKELFKFCDDNNDAINELRSQSDNTDFLLAVLIQQLKDSGVIDEISPEPKPQLKQLDQSVFNGLDEKWRFAAVDEGSYAFKFDCEPAINCDEWYEGHGQQKVFIGAGYDASDWKNSLIERKAELTGSELVRAMLSKNGDKCVMCRVTDNPDVPVKNWLLVVVEMSNIGYHDYIMPINNKGERLSAEDVGL